MATVIRAPVDVRLYYEAPSTIRTWLLILNLIVAHGQPLMVTISDLAESSSGTGARPLSRGSVGKAIWRLEALGAVSVERRGHAMALRMPASEAA